MSPPCQSWSRAGRWLGLGDINGWAFVDALLQALVLQPVILLAECSDEITVHNHFSSCTKFGHHAGF